MFFEAFCPNDVNDEVPLNSSKVHSWAEARVVVVVGRHFSSDFAQ